MGMASSVLGMELTVTSAVSVPGSGSCRSSSCLYLL